MSMINILLSAVLVAIVLQPVTAQTFQEVSRQSGINAAYKSNALMGGGVAVFDYDNDGFDDIYFARGAERDHLYKNNGDGTFSERGAEAGIVNDEKFYTMGAVTADIDNDGDRDIFVCTWGKKDQRFARNLVYINNGNGTFTERGEVAGIIHASWSSSASFTDINNDGYPDIYVVNYVRSHGNIVLDPKGEVEFYKPDCFANFFYINNRNGGFTEEAAAYGVADSGGCGLAAAFSDYNTDGYPDLLIANDFGTWARPNRLFVNTGSGFADVSATSGMEARMFGMGIAPGDFDEDGDMDYYITNIGSNKLMRNNGDGSFSDIARTAGIENQLTGSEFTTGWGTAFLDYDNDSFLDLVVTNGYVATEPIIITALQDRDKLYKGNGRGTFSDVSLPAGFNSPDLSRGVAAGDFDHDGDLDLVVSVIDSYESPDPHFLLYKNNTAGGGNWLKILLRGVVSSKDAFGARVVVHSGVRKFVREPDGGSGFSSQHSATLHVGLGPLDQIDSVEIFWPSRRRQVEYNIVPNSFNLIMEDAALPVITSANEFDESSLMIFPNPASQHLAIELRATGTRFAEIFLMTHQGRVVNQGRLTPGHDGLLESVISLEGVSPGLYIVEIRTPAKRTARKVVIQR